MTTPRRVLSLCAVVVILLLAGATPASAHAALLASTPADGSVLETAPAEVLLRFSEGVGTRLGAVKVLAPDGSRVDVGEVTSRDRRRQVVVALRPDLAHGTYLISWRVLSEDSHSVSGSSTFSVGHPSEVAAAPVARGGAAAWALGVSRFIGFLGLVGVVGAAVFGAVVGVPTGRPRALRRLLLMSWGLAAIGTALSVFAQGSYAADLPLRDGLRPTLVRAVVETRFGTAMCVRLATLGALLMVLVLTGLRTRRAAALAVALGGVAVVATSSSGHAGVGSFVALSVPADALHLLAGCTWVGGLVLLTTIVLPDGNGAELTRLLPRWSWLAAASVGALVATGLYASWREVRELDALPSTTYGRLLLSKTALVLLMVTLGALGQRWVRRHARAESGAAPRVARIRRSVGVEAALALVVLAVTAALVETTPARSAYAPMFVGRATVIGEIDVEVQVEPARAGVNAMHVYFTGAGGKAVDVEEVRAVLIHARSGDRVDVDVPRDSLGHYEQLRVALPASGDWRLDLFTRTSDIQSTTSTFTIPVR